MSMISIFLLDNSNNIKEEINIIKPKSYQELLDQLKLNFKNIQQSIDIFIMDKNNKEIKIKNEEEYKIIGNILLIRVKNKELIKQSVFERNYNKLSESKREILDEKYECNICSIIIKNEDPYLCYKCQKIFHVNCLKNWDNQCKSQNKKLSCPNCRNQLEIEKWNKKLYFEEDRNYNANLLNKINEYKYNNKYNIDNDSFEELNNNMKKKDEIIQKYENYIIKTKEVFKKILNQINSIHNLLKLENNNKLNNVIKNYSFNIQNLELNEISDVINNELEEFKLYIMNKNKTNIKININKPDNDYINKNERILINNNFNKVNYNEIKKDQYKNKIDLIYNAKLDGDYNIFGEEFVKNNKDNIELIINGKKTVSVKKCRLKGGDNIITIIIKNKLINLSNMFSMCNQLKDISELKYFDVSDCNNFECMFDGCSFLSDIKALENWNVSNGKIFKGMFWGCSLLSDIKPLQNWDVSKGTNFEYLFTTCSSLSDIKPLSNWNVSNGSNFRYMFSGCSLLSDIKPLQNWNVSKSSNFTSMFKGCKYLSDIRPLQEWNVSNCNNFEAMFGNCTSLSDITPLTNWNVSKCTNFQYMFSGCSSLSNIKPLQNWYVANCDKFNYMFSFCSPSLNVKPLDNWNVSKEKLEYIKYEEEYLGHVYKYLFQSINIFEIINFVLIN